MPVSEVRCHHGPCNTFTMTSPIGDLELVCCPRGIHKLSHIENNFQPQPSDRVNIKSQLYQDNGYTHKAALLGVDWLNKYFEEGKLVKYDTLPPICHLTQVKGSFKHRVWETLVEKVQFGETITYGGLASMCGSPGAAQAVGQAMRTNPVMILVPCHRVLPASGGTGNYAGGQKNTMKTWLLQHEGSLPLK